jgi:oxepin-CoA hydrolase/3-oxo-5,6-dehydrosuberyl-CoA semialdehyde dehydrogenase
MSVAAGLFVDSYEINPVLLNYGIDELRFTKPVYPGTNLHVRFTCKEKTTNELKDENDIPKGIVKWLVEIFDDSSGTEAEQLVGIATILTMVAE